MEIILVYKTDFQHSFASRDLIGVVRDTHPVTIINQYISKNNMEEMGHEQVWNLNNIGQTQGYIGDCEFATEKVEADTLL